MRLKLIRWRQRRPYLLRRLFCLMGWHCLDTDCDGYTGKEWTTCHDCFGYFGDLQIWDNKLGQRRPATKGDEREFKSHHHGRRLLGSK